MNNTKSKAINGLGYINDTSGDPAQKTLAGWKQWAEREARKLSKRDRFTWHGVVAWIEWRDCYRVSFGSIPMDKI